MRSKYHWTALSALVLCAISNSILLAAGYQDIENIYQYYPKETLRNIINSNKLVLLNSEDVTTAVDNSKDKQTEKKQDTLFKFNRKVNSNNYDNINIKTRFEENKIDFKTILNNFENDPKLSQVLEDDILLSVLDKNAIVKNVVRPSESNKRSKRIKKYRRNRRSLLQKNNIEYVNGNNSNANNETFDDLVTIISVDNNTKNDLENASVSGDSFEIKENIGNQNILFEQITKNGQINIENLLDRNTFESSHTKGNSNSDNGRRRTRAKFFANVGQNDDPFSAFTTGNSFRDRLSFSDALNQHPFSSTSNNHQYGQQRQHNAEDGINVNFHYADNGGGGGLTPTRIVKLKQGLVQGSIVEAKMQHALSGVERYLGLPYAAAPVGGLRFMPPGTAPPWTGLRSANHLPPVCPQTPPPLTSSSMGRTSSTGAGAGVSPGRYAQLKRLLPYLKNQSEDCLYLNIYAPLQEESGPLYKYPVLVFIHGESYEWNSGNPYDGSVLAAYAKLVVVTINFRLGILGFMRPGINEHTVSNFALLDQIAALQWIKDNIERFGGDRGAVTVAGHGTGAACANLLMVSPVANGLFHRAILMSGSALSDWAMASNPLQSTIQVVQSLNCPLGEKDEEMVACLRKKRLSEIMAIRVTAPKYSTPFGPLVDGQVVPNDPDLVMKKYNNLFSRYECLYGVTEQESYHLLSGHALLHGMAEADKDSALRFYFQSRFEYRPDLALASTVREYSSLSQDIDASPLRSLATAHRDVLLDVLSDARVIAPLVLTGHYHSRVNAQSYMYVFAHNSQYGPYADLEKSVHGEELAYLFGAPVEYRGGPFISDYLPQEALLSEVVMTYFTNFVKTGNPNAPRRSSYLHMSPLDWREFDLEWPEYNGKNQSYMFLSVPPNIAHKYRVRYTRFWNQELPQALKNSTSYTSGSVVGSAGHNRLSSYTPGGGALGRMVPESRDNRQEGGRAYANINYRPGSSSHDYGTFRMYPHASSDYEQSMRTTTMDPFMAIKVLTGRAPGLMDGPPAARSEEGVEDIIDDMDFDIDNNNNEVGYTSASMTTSVLIAIGLTVLLINSLAIALFYYRKAKRSKTPQNRGQPPPRTFSAVLPRATTVDFLEENSYGNPTPCRSGSQRTTSGLTSILSRHNQETSGDSKARKFIHNLLKRNNSNNGGSSNSNRFFPSSVSKSSSSRQSQPTQSKNKPEKHSRVRDWIQQEIVQRCSPKVARKESATPTPVIQLKQSHLPKPNAKRGALTGSLKAPVDYVTANPSNSIAATTTFNEKPNKVSVAVDATPSARDSIILRQQPIELTKKARADVIIDENSEEDSISSKFDTKNENETKTLEFNLEPTVVKIEHFRSVSEPEPLQPVVKLQTFTDINVTSRDEVDFLYSEPPTAEETLQTIKRRKFPKVLPDYPDQEDVTKRYTLPALYDTRLLQFTKTPPPPPPRISSTLRKESNDSDTVDQIENKKAQMSENSLNDTTISSSLQFGPLVPRTKDIEKESSSSIYESLKTTPKFNNYASRLIEQPRYVIGPKSSGPCKGLSNKQMGARVDLAPTRNVQFLKSSADSFCITRENSDSSNSSSESTGTVKLNTIK